MGSLARKVCQDPQANPLAIVRVLDDDTKKAWHEWLPEQCQDELDLAEGSQQLNKVLACQVAATNPDVFEDWDLFHHVGTAFNHHIPNFQWLDKPSHLEVAWACGVLLGINSAHSYGPGVLRYIFAVCVDEGLVYFPWTGGEGLLLAEEAPKLHLQGMLPDDKGLGKKMRELWLHGGLRDVEPDPSAVTDDDPLHVQILLLASANAYIRAQKSAAPEDYA